MISPQNTPETVEQFLQVTGTSNLVDQWLAVKSNELGMIEECMRVYV